MKNKKFISFLIVMFVFIFANVYSVRTSYALAPIDPPNLIQNSSVEVASGGNPSLWLQSGFGVNNRTFSYPVTGVSGGSAINVKISSYTSGDAKWSFPEVPILSNRSYIYTDNYMSDISTVLVAEYFDASHNHLSYVGFIPVPASPLNSWGTSSTTFITPVGAAYMTVYHLINNVGSLTTDNFSLTEVPLPEAFDKGFVSLTFDDGFLSQYQNALPELSAANIKGTFYVVSHAISGLSISNSSLEEADSSALPLDAPLDWTFSGGVNTISTYPVAGHSGQGAFASSLAIDTNAAWAFKPISVINDSVYSFSEWYKSTTNSDLVAIINKTDGSTIQADITDLVGNTIGSSVSLPSTNNVWTQVNAYFYVPLDAKSVTVVNQLKGIGDLVIDDVTLSEPNYMNSIQLKSLQTAGQEIGGHTQSHKDLPSISLADAEKEVSGGLHDLLTNGIDPVLPFDYPYGNYNQNIQQIVESSGFTSGRTVAPGFNGKDTNKFALLSQSVNADTPLSTVEAWINQAISDHTWLILVFHEIQSDLTKAPFGTTPSNLQLIVDYIKNNNIETQTISGGISLMNQTLPPEVTLNSIAITTPATKLSYTVGDSLDIGGLIVTGTYSDNSTKIETLTSSNVTGFNSAVPAVDQVLTITIGGKTTTYKINILAVVPPPVVLNNISITNPASKLVYKVGELLDITGLVITGTYSDNSTKVETLGTESITGFNSSSPVNSQILTITINGKTTTYTVNIIKDEVVNNHGSYSGSFLPKDLKLVIKDLPIGKVLGAESYRFNKDLKFGMKNASVKELQSKFKKEGVYKGPITGYFGALTKEVVKKYQQKNELPPTGFVGPLTREILNTI